MQRQDLKKIRRNIMPPIETILYISYTKPWLMLSVFSWSGNMFFRRLSDGRREDGYNRSMECCDEL